MAAKAQPGRVPITVYLIAGRKGLGSAPHEDLVNFAGEAKSAENFHNRWGDLFPSLNPPENPDQPSEQRKLADMVTLPRFLGEYRDILREAWRTDPKKLNLFENLAGNERSEVLGSIPQALISIHDDVARHMKTTWEFKKGGIQITPDNLWTTICILFLRDHAAGRTGICANPSCAAPYFLKRRKTQKFCEAGVCTAYAQRQYANSWWQREGKARRAKKHRRKQ
jgi:hypothetical protein